jgi:hypothetical protein
MAAVTVGDLARFAGGAHSSVAESAVVDEFDSRTRSGSTATLSQTRCSLAATTVGQKAIFAGGTFDGLGNPSRQASAVVDVHDASFAGGDTQNSASAAFDIYDDSAGTWSTTALSQARSIGRSAVATTGTCVCFAGGQVASSTMSAAVDVYDASTGTWWSTNLWIARHGAVAAVVIDGFDLTTGAWRAATNFMVPRAHIAVATVDGQALFAGGSIDIGGGWALTSRVDVFDTPGAESVRLGRSPNPDALRPATVSGPTLGAI